MKALKTYNQYHTDCLIAEGKLKEAERLEERHTGKSSELGPGQSGGQRRSSVKKMERLMEKVSVGSRSQEVLTWVFNRTNHFLFLLFWVSAVGHAIIIGTS